MKTPNNYETGAHPRTPEKKTKGCKAASVEIEAVN
jgi:hypothetical protein